MCEQNTENTDYNYYMLTETSIHLLGQHIT